MKRRQPQRGVRCAGALLVLLLGTAGGGLHAQSVAQRIDALGAQISALSQGIQDLQAQEAPSEEALAPIRLQIDSIQRQLRAVRATYAAVGQQEGEELAARMEASASQVGELLARRPAARQPQPLNRAPTAQRNPVMGLATDWRLLRACCALDLDAPPQVAQEPPPPPQQLRMPEVEGLPIQEAVRVLDRVGIQVASESPLPSSATPGTVVRQRPQAGTGVRRGDSADLWVAAEPELAMPGLVGQELSAAGAALRRLELRLVQVDSIESDEAAEGTVVRQDPEPGTIVEPGARVRLAIAVAPLVVVSDSGGARPLGAEGEPPPEEPTPLPRTMVDSVFVPDVGLRSLAEARRLLAAAELRPVLPPELRDSTRWLVAGQTPIAGVRVPAGSGVTLDLLPPTVVSGESDEGGGVTVWPWVLVAAGLLALGGGVWWWRAARTPPPSARPEAAPTSRPPPPPAPVVLTNLRISPVRPEMEIAQGRPLRRHEVRVGLRSGSQEIRVESGVPFIPTRR